MFQAGFCLDTAAWNIKMTGLQSVLVGSLDLE